MRRLLFAVLALVLFPLSAVAQIVQGPVHNPMTGSRYYVVQTADWNAAQSLARSIGGDLCTVGDMAENNWIMANLSNGGNRKLFIGLSDSASEGQFTWSDGSTAAYRNWLAPEPSSDDYTVVTAAPGNKWLAVRADYTQFAVVEVAGPVHVPGEYSSIQAAINAVQAGSTILVAPGTYNERFSFAGKGVVIRAVAGPSLTTINGQGVSPIVSFGVSEPSTAMLDGFTVRNGGTSPGLGGIRVPPGGSPTIRNCVVREIGSVSVGGSLLIEGSSPTFINCRLTANSGVAGVGATIIYGANPTFINCVIDGNNATSGTALYMLDSIATLRNCTIVEPAGFNAMLIEGTTSLTVRNSIIRSTGTPISVRPPAAATVTHSNLTFPFSGIGNLSADPRFLATGDFRLAANSPCIDAGDVLQYAGFGPDMDIAGQPRARNAPATPDTGVGLPPIDIGAYEFQPLSEGCAADFNQSGSVTVQDIFDFLAAYFAGCP